METEHLREAVEGVMALRNQDAQPKLAERVGRSKLDIDHYRELMEIKKLEDNDFEPGEL